MNKETTCCFTGHRPKDLWGYDENNNYKYETLQEYIYNLIDNLYNRGYRTFITGGAQGFDTCVFWAIEQLKFDHNDIENVIFSPCPYQEKFWKEDGIFGKTRYRKALDKADDIRYITDTYIPSSMQLRNQAMINNSSMVIALTNETPEEKKSGTIQTVKMAEKQENYNIITVNYDLETLNFSINERASKGLSETRKVKLGERNLVGLNNHNPVPELPVEGFGDVICFDTETTGFNYATYDELLQIAVVGSNGNEWMTYIKPEKHEVWRQAEKINHITPATVKNAPSAFSVMQSLYPYFKEAKLIVGHNVQFDLNFIDAAGLKVGTPVWDTCTYFKTDIPKVSHKLIHAVETYCPEEVEAFRDNAHDALADTRATMRVYEAQVKKENEKLEEIER